MVPAAAPGGPATTRPPGRVARSRAGRRLAVRLERAGARVGPGAAVAAAAAVAGVAALAGFAVMRTPVAAVAGAVAAVVAAAAYLKSADRRHLDRLEAQLPGLAQGLSAA